VKAEAKPPVTSALADVIALEAARAIIALMHNIPAGQLQARVQCIVLQAIKRAEPTPRGR
jgi:hypothetical protein